MLFVNLQGYECEYSFLSVLDKDLFLEALENLIWRMPATSLVPCKTLGLWPAKRKQQSNLN